MDNPPGKPQEQDSNAQIIDEWLLSILVNNATRTGQLFLNDICCTLQQQFAVDYVFIARYYEPANSILTLSLCDHGEIIHNRDCELQGPPCTSVINGKPCMYNGKARQQFPDNSQLQEMQADAYIGVPLVNDDQNVIGLIVMLNHAAITNGFRCQRIMQALAPRITAEIERIGIYEALEASQQRYQDLIQDAPEGIVLFDAELNRFVEVNRAAEQLFKMTAAELMRCSPGDLSPEHQSDGRDSYRTTEELIAKTQAGASHHFEWQHQNAEGDIIDCEVRLHPVVSGEKILVRGTITDISDKKQADELLRNSEENLRITLNSIADAVIATDKEHCIHQMNPVAEHLIGRTQDDCIGATLESVLKVYPVDQADAPLSLNQILGNDASFEHNQQALIMRNADDQEYTVSCNASPIKNVDGEEVGAVFVLRDISRQREVEDQLRQAQKMESIGQLAGGIAHDFNNMLAGIIATGELMMLSMDDPEQLNYLQNIVDTSLRAAELTQQLLTFSRKGKVESKPININDSITNVMALLDRSLDKRIQVVTEFKADRPIITGDQSQIESALLNLGVNARDAMPDGGILTFSTSEVFLNEHDCEDTNFDIDPGAHLRIDIKDTGIGIDPAIRSFIFEPFFTTKDVGKGTGLGLAAVYGTTCEHKGMIQVSSDTVADNGTTVSLFLPLADESTDIRKSRQPDITSGKGNILIIDDEEIIRRINCDLLSSVGYRVSSAADGAAGLQMVKDQPEFFDAILLDLVMPHLNGRDTFYKIKGINEHINVILTSGYGQDADINRMLKDGARLFIQKPFRFHELSQSLDRILNNQ